MGYCENLLLPAEPVEKEFDEIIQVILSHLNHKPLIYCSRIQVLLIKSMGNESVVQYMAELHRLINKRNFRQCLEKTLRERLMCWLF